MRADAAPVVSKLTLVRSKTDNVLVIKNKQPAAGQSHCLLYTSDAADE